MSSEPTHSSPADARNRVFGVTELTRAIKRLLEDRVGTIQVEGEISNYRRQASGHCYFTLKDSGAQLSAVLFRREAAGVRVELGDGRQIRATGEITVYAARGQYQLICRHVEEAGRGALYEAFEKLKAQLREEGLFEASRKRPLPALPARIGLVTSPTGAALRDMLQVLGRRFPDRRLLVVPTRVQGEGAAGEIAAALDRINRVPDVDVLILGRGGGSIEDLWAFNEEAVARAIARSRIPVISGIGHETDITMADYVADFRAPTPSAAAENVLRPKADYEQELAAWSRRLGSALRRGAQHRETRLARDRERLRRCMHGRLTDLAQRLDSSGHRMERAARGRWQAATRRLEHTRNRMRAVSPQARLRRDLQRLQQARTGLLHLGATLSSPAHHRLDQGQLALQHATRIRLHRARARFDRHSGRLQALSPQATLQRGFSVTLTDQGQVLTDAGQIAPGQVLETRLAHGRLTSDVRLVHPHPQGDDHEQENK